METNFQMKLCWTKSTSILLKIHQFKSKVFCKKSYLPFKKRFYEACKIEDRNNYLDTADSSFM